MKLWQSNHNFFLLLCFFFFEMMTTKILPLFSEHFTGLLKRIKSTEMTRAPHLTKTLQFWVENDHQNIVHFLKFVSFQSLSKFFRSFFDVFSMFFKAFSGQIQKSISNSEFKIRFKIKKQKLKLTTNSNRTKAAYKLCCTWICAGPH